MAFSSWQYEGHVACTTNSTDTGRKGKMLSQTKIAQLSGPSPFGLDTQVCVCVCARAHVLACACVGACARASCSLSHTQI